MYASAVVWATARSVDSGWADDCRFDGVWMLGPGPENDLVDNAVEGAVRWPISYLRDVVPVVEVVVPFGAKSVVIKVFIRQGTSA